MRVGDAITIAKAITLIGLKRYSNFFIVDSAGLQRIVNEDRETAELTSQPPSSHYFALQTGIVKTAVDP